MSLKPSLFASFASFAFVARAQFEVEEISSLFEQTHSIVDSPDPHGRVDLVDLDADGDLDVIVGTHYPLDLGGGTFTTGGGIPLWYENLGGGVLAPAQNLTTYETDFNHVVGGDVDNDGDIDFVTMGRAMEKLVLHENNGAGVFTPHVIDEAPWSAIVELVDFDQDGDLDIFWAPVTSNFCDRQLVWLENVGANTFTKQVLITGCIQYDCIDFADVDGDGDLDVFVCINYLGGGDTILAWFERRTNGFIFREVPGSRLDLGLLGDVIAKDFDGDGRVDVLIAQPLHDVQAQTSRFTWNRNLGNKQFSSPIELDVQSVGAVVLDEVIAEDIDGDGDIDIVFGKPSRRTGDRDRVFMFENDGSGNFSPPQLLIDFGRVPIGTGIRNLLVTEAGDFTSDGTPEILTISIVREGQSRVGYDLKIFDKADPCGNCNDPRTDPGCDIPEVESCVCNIAPIFNQICCGGAWDVGCVGIVLSPAWGCGCPV